MGSYEEYIKLLYDMCKHITTLSIGTTVVLVAISGEGPLPYISLGLLGISVISGLVGMPRASAVLILEGEKRRKAISFVYWATNIGATCLVVAIISYALFGR